MKDNEIIKALECCGDADCDNCPYSGDDLLRPCNDNLVKDTIDLINRQKAEIERLEDLNKCYYTSCQQIAKSNYEIKAEAIKETIEAIKRKSSSGVMVNNGIPVASTRHYTISEVNLYEIEKEMVGDANV